MTRIAWSGLGLVAVVAIGIGGWKAITAQEVYRKDQVAGVQLDMIADGLRDYAARHGKLPSIDQGLTAVVNDGQLKRQALVDPWSQPITYRCIRSDCTRVEIASAGASDASNKGGLSRIVE